MRIGIIKQYLLKEANIDKFTVRLIADKKVFALEIERDNSIIFKENFDNIESANVFFDLIFKKSYSNFNLRKARINSDDPKAFRKDSPSENFGIAYDGGGGFLNHIKKVRDDFRSRKNRKNKPKENPINNDGWDAPSNKDDKNYQLTKIGPPAGQISRDDEKNRPGLADNDTWKQRSTEGTRPNIPTDEDSIERMRHPERYDSSAYRGPDTNPSAPSEIGDNHQEKLTKDKIREQQDQVHQKFTIVFEKGGKTQEIPNLTYEKAIQISEQYPACVIRKMKRKEKEK